MYGDDGFIVDIFKPKEVEGEKDKAPVARGVVSESRVGLLEEPEEVMCLVVKVLEHVLK